MESRFVPLLLSAVILSLARTSNGLGLSCTDHPAYFSGLTPTLMKSWKVLNGPDFESGNYHVNPSTHQYAPLEDEESTKYKGLDVFWNYQTGEGPEFIQLELQRAAKVYMLVVFDYDENYPEVELEGWKSEEYVGLVKGDGEDMLVGVHQKGERWMPWQAYAFSKVVDGEITLPSGEWVKENVRGGKPMDEWILLLAEEDGSAPSVPKNPAGISAEIKPNERCPDELHDLWVTESTDTNDADTDGMKWPTWHPMWDPCYWCAYDHDHGSSPKDLMGYQPKFGYVAWKNGRETELHQGFKGVVFQEDDKLVYFMMHGQTSNVRRLGVRFHTVTLVVADAETKEILLEVGHKGDFGFISARKEGGGVVPLQEEDEKMMADFEERDMFRQRTVNVINEGNLNPEYLYRDSPQDILRGEYEEWTTNPICSLPGYHGALRMDFTSSISGIKVASDLTDKLDLGSDSDLGFIKNNGVGRIFRAREYKLEESMCMFRISDINGGRSSDGEFYTDVFGTKLVSKASADAVRQFVKPGFSLTLDGDYEATDSWTGMYKKDHEGRMNNYGYGVDPAVN